MARKKEHRPWKLTAGWKLEDFARITYYTKEKETTTMAKHEVTGQAQPAMGVPAEQLDTLKRMPPAPGALYATPQQKMATGTSSVAVSNKPKDDGGLPASMPVPASSEYVPPPDKVTSQDTRTEPSR